MRPAHPERWHRPARSRQGFTLIEILTVLVIISILASILLATIGIVQRRVEYARVETGVRRLTTLLAQADSKSGIGIRPIAHPLAATAAGAFFPDLGQEPERALFVRNGALLGQNDLEALLVADVAHIASSQHQRVLLPDDRFAGYRTVGDVPSLFGLPRRGLTLLAPGAEWIHQARKLPTPGGDYDNGSGGLKPGNATPPYGNDLYPDSEFLATQRLKPGVSYESSVNAYYRLLLGEDLPDLSEAGLIRTSPEADTSAWTSWDPDGFGDLAIDVLAPRQGAYDQWHRVWVPQASVGAYRPGLAQIDGAWRAYQPRGPHLIDGFGREVLVVSGHNGTLHVASSGRDGSFLVSPGNNGVIDTDPTTYDPADPATLGADDSDAQKDNIGKNPWF